MTGMHTAVFKPFAAVRVFLRCHQLQVGCGLVQPFGRSVRSWKGILRDAVALYAFKSFSPSLAVLGHGELVLGVKGVSRPTKRRWPQSGAVLLLLLLVVNALILADHCSTRE